MKKLGNKQMEMVQGGIEISPGLTIGIICVGTWAGMIDSRSSNSLSYFLAEFYAAYCL